MVTMTVFHAEKCCHLVSEHEASDRRLCSIYQFLISLVHSYLLSFSYLVLDGMEAETASVTVLEQLPEPVLNDLRLIASWLLCCGYDTDFMQVYATVRSPLLVKSLHTYVACCLLALFC